jgi:hypothetical protein
MTVVLIRELFVFNHAYTTLLTILDILYFPLERNLAVSYKCNVIMTTIITIESKAQSLKYHYSSRISCFLRRFQQMKSIFAPDPSIDMVG